MKPIPAFDTWLARARPGEWHTYAESNGDKRPSKALLRHVMEACEAGLVTLAQKRLDEGRYEYRAQRILRRRG